MSSTQNVGNRSAFFGKDESGYFCIDQDGSPILQGEIHHGRTELHVTADQPIEIDKMFGPLIFWPVRVTADLQSGDWIIERMHGEDDEWHEWCRIPGQREEDFTDA